MSSLLLLIFVDSYSWLVVFLEHHWLIFPVGNHHPNWRTHIFQRGRLKLPPNFWDPPESWNIVLSEVATADAICLIWFKYFWKNEKTSGHVNRELYQPSGPSRCVSDVWHFPEAFPSIFGTDVWQAKHFSWPVVSWCFFGSSLSSCELRRC